MQERKRQAVAEGLLSALLMKGQGRGEEDLPTHVAGDTARGRHDHAREGKPQRAQKVLG